MKNILTVADYAAPYKGSFIDALISLNDNIIKYGNNFIIILPNRCKDREWAKKIISEGIIIYFLTNSFKKNIKLIKKIILDYNIDIIHTHFLGGKNIIEIKFALLTKKIPLIMHRHGMGITNGSLLSRLKRKIIYRADKYICVSEAVKNELLKFGIKKSNLVCLYNGIKFTRLEEGIPVLKKDIGLSNYSFIIMMMGYDIWIKGVDIAIRAIEKANLYYDFQLIIPMPRNKNKIIKDIESTIGYFPSWVKLLDSTEFIGQYYKLSDLFISPSRTEGLCNAIIEAAYLKIPMVISDIEPQLNIGLKNIKVFKQNDFEDLYNKIIDVYNNNFTDDALEENKKHVTTNFDIDKWTINIINIYNEY